MFNKAKIIATVAIKNLNKKKIKDFLEAGVSIFRINSSHLNKKEIEKSIDLIQSVINKKNLNASILQDLQGPKIRVGKLEHNINLISNQYLKISNSSLIGNSQIISTNYNKLLEDVKIEEKILIDDGKITLLVKDKTKEYLYTKVLHGGILKPKKGINLPNTSLSNKSLTDKDIEDLHIGLSKNIEWLALSFVRTEKDIQKLRKIIDKKGKKTKIIAKIEKPEAVNHIDKIIKEADAIMVARGDLGVEIPMEEVPLIQKSIVKKCNMIGKPVIIATQMMESMIENPIPTRAEINDIANAVLDGADALMLSAETAIGSYPLKVVEKMKDTICHVETNYDIYNKYYESSSQNNLFYSDNIVQTACILAEKINSKAIIGSTLSGYTALEISKNRPKSNIFIFTKNENIIRMLSLVWGITSFFFDKILPTEKHFKEIEKILLKNNFLNKNDVCIHVINCTKIKNYNSGMLKISII